VSQLATAVELAGYLQQDLDTYSATQALTLASGEFEAAADTKFSSSTATEVFEGRMQPVLALSRHPVIAVTQVRIDGVVIVSTDYKLVGQNLYRVIGWGGRAKYPETIEVDETYGYTAVADDAKLAVLQLAAGLYAHPDPNVSMEQIDDYVVRYDGNPILPGEPWPRVAARYRAGGFA
jgi:hypothetical protein